MGKQALALVGVHRETAWRNRLARYAASQLTVEAFCRREAVPVGTFYGWRARLRACGVDFDAAPAPQTAPALSPSPFLDLGSVNRLSASAAAPESDDGPPHCTPSDIDIRLDLGHGVVLHIVRH